MKVAILFGKAREPMQGITSAEEVELGVNVVEQHILLAAIEAGLREIQRGCGGSRQGGADREGSRVSEQVEHGLTRMAEGSKVRTVVPLVDEESLRIARLHIKDEADAVFRDVEKEFLFGLAERSRGVFLFLVEELDKGISLTAQETIA